MVLFFCKGIGDFVSAYCNVFVTQSCTTLGDLFSRTTLQKEWNKGKKLKINKNPNGKKNGIVDPSVILSNVFEELN